MKKQEGITGAKPEPQDHPAATILRNAPFGFAPVPGTRFEMHENGLAVATAGGFTARIFRATSGGDVARNLHWHDADFQYVHILKGEIEFLLDGDERCRLQAGDAIYQPSGCRHCVMYVSPDLELLEIFSPAEIATTRVTA